MINAPRFAVRTTTLVLVSLLVMVSTVHANDTERPLLRPSLPSAIPAARGIEQIGLLSDTRVGVTDNITLLFHPLLFFAAPTVEASITWSSSIHEDSGSAFASWHRLSYPSPFYRMLQSEGAGGVITPEVAIGPVVSFTNGIRYSVRAREHLLTGEAGIEVAFGRLDERTSVDLPLLYPRMVVFYDGWLANASLTYERSLSSTFACALIATVMANDTHHFLELTPRVSWNIDDHWSVHLDPIVTYGTYPFGDQWQLVIVPDVTYRF